MNVYSDYTEIVRACPEMQYISQRRRERQDAMHLMSQRPAKSGWIRLLHNRVSLSAYGNRTYSVKVWYDARTRMVGKTFDKCDIPFRSARLKCDWPPAGWMYMDDYYRFKNQ